MDCSLPDSSLHGILQARILEWVAISFSRGSSQPRSPALQGDALTSEPPGKPLRILCKHQEISTYPALGEHLLLLWRGLVFSGSLPCGTCCCVLVPQSCLTICDPMDCSLPGSSAHGIFQARVLEWGAIAFSVKKAEHRIIDPF